MTQKYTAQDVTEDLAGLLTLTKVYEVDDQNFWIDRQSRKRFQYPVEKGGKTMEIANFQNPMPKGDFLYFNPFAESFGKKSPANSLFYSAIRVAFNVKLAMVIMFVAEQILASKKDESIALDPTITKMGSVRLDRNKTLFDVIDDTMITEFKTIEERTEASEEANLIHVPYISAQLTARVRCEALTDEHWAAKYASGIRKKSVLAYRSLLLGVLGLKDPSELSSFSVKYDTSLKTTAKLYCTISVYLELYSRFNEVLSEDDAIDLGRLQSIIENFTAAHAIAKHMIQPVVSLDPTSVKTTDTSIATHTAPVHGRSRFEPHIVGGGPLDAAAGPIQGSRFQPHVVGGVPVQSTSYIQNNTGYLPQSQPSGYMSSGGGISLNSMGNQGGISLNTGGFNSGGLNYNPPNNYSIPGAMTNYFGN